MADQSWREQVEAARKEGGPIFQKNGLPIRAIRHDGALLEHEHADHPSYLFPVTVEFAGEKPDFFHERFVKKDVRPAHYGVECAIEWNRGEGKAFCKTCNVALTTAEQVHIDAYWMASVEESMHEPRDEALIFHDESIALTLYECSYTVWHRRGNSAGEMLFGPGWMKGWRLTAESVEKIWGKVG